MTGAEDLEEVPHLSGGCKPCRRFGDGSPGGGGLTAPKGRNPGGESHGTKKASLIHRGIDLGPGPAQAGREGGEIDMGGDVDLARPVQEIGPAMAGDRLQRVACGR